MNRVFSGLADLFQHISGSVFPQALLYYHLLSFSNHPAAVFMEELEVYIIAICLEGILYGVIKHVPFLLFAKEVFLVLYCGIFALYLRYAYGETRTIIFYAICLLFVLSTVTFVADLVKFILEEVLLVSYNSITKDIFLFISCVVPFQYK